LRNLPVVLAAWKSSRLHDIFAEAPQVAASGDLELVHVA